MTDSHPTDNHCTEAQALRLAVALRLGPVSTIEAAQSLDIVHPPSSVRWLRNRGFSIKTEWTYKTTEPGRRPHRVGLYVLASEPS
ncbi:helix-turn-helix domain-containing protein [Pseudomonas sp. S8]|uniref:helix-turn-helix domain-containing protein n=1 Tax=Pseudomonas sp. S8 TaxID=211136 RepID=UPI003D2D4F88